MALNVTHSYVSTVAEAPTSGIPGGTVGPTEWNAAHTVTGNLPVTQLNSGTGATTSTFWRGDGTWSAVGAQSVNYINVKNSPYNAVGDGVANDTAAINSAIAAFNTAGSGVLYFPAGTYLINAALTAITAKGMVYGDGMAGGYTGLGAPVSLIKSSSGTAVVFTVNALSFKFEKVALQNSAVSPTTSVGIQVLNGSVIDQTVSYESVSVQGFHINIDIQVGAVWTMNNCNIVDGSLYGIKIQNTLNHDNGDWQISNTNVTADTVAGTSGIRIESSGGGKIVNTKINGVNASATQYTNGIDITPTVSDDTGIMLIANCSIENTVTTGVNSNGNWRSINICNCEFLDMATGVLFNNNRECLVNNCTFRNLRATGVACVNTSGGSIHIVATNIFNVGGYGGQVVTGTGYTAVSYSDPTNAATQATQSITAPGSTGFASFIGTNDANKRVLVEMYGSAYAGVASLAANALVSSDTKLILAASTTVGSGGTFDISLRPAGYDTGGETVLISHLGSVICGRLGVVANAATDGFLYIPTVAGTPTGVPTSSTGGVAMIYDTTNNKLYIYNGGWKGGTNPGAFT